MNRKELIKKILELSIELKNAEGMQAIMCIDDMERVVIDYENHIKKLNTEDESKQFYCFTKRGCLEQCTDCSLAELEKR